MRIKMSLDLTKENANEDLSDLILLDEFDNNDLAKLFYTGYHNSIDDEGESVGDWGEIISQFKNNEFGELIHEASLVIKVKGEIVSGIVIGIDEDKPYIIALATNPRCRNKGLAGRLIRSSARVLESNHNQLVLYVDEANIEAVRLYKKLGFEIVE